MLYISYSKSLTMMLVIWHMRTTGFLASNTWRQIASWYPLTGSCETNLELIMPRVCSSASACMDSVTSGDRLLLSESGSFRGPRSDENI